MHKSKSWPSMADEFAIHEGDIKCSGFLRKESIHWKVYRNRWCVLTSQYLCSYRNEGDYRTPTETLALTDCLSVKSADNETGRENSFCVVTRDRTFFLIASSADEKEQWSAAIMNTILPALSSRGLRRSLSLFSIGEQDQEDDDDEWTFVTSPKRWPKSLMAPRSSSKSKVSSPPNVGDGANATPAEFKVPSLDTDDPFDPFGFGAIDGDTSAAFDLPPCSSSSNTNTINLPSINGCSDANNGSNDSPRATPKALTTPREFLSDDSLLEVADDRSLVSPKVLPSLMQLAPPGTIAQGARDLLDVMDKHAKEEVPMDFDEVTEAWQQERFQVGAKSKRVSMALLVALTPSKCQPE